jgi:hypothetical protein
MHEHPAEVDKSQYRERDTNRINAITNTGDAMKNPYQPGLPRRGSGTRDTAPRAKIARYTIPVIHQSSYSPVARANSLNPTAASRVTPRIVASLPRNSVPSTIGIMMSQPR